MNPQVLTAKRAAYIAATTDIRVRENTIFGTTHADNLSLDDFRAFAECVWRREGRSEPLVVNAIESLPESVVTRWLANSAGHARWSLPPPRFPRVMTGYIDVTVEGRNRLAALHEIAHLLCDTVDETRGHGEEWARTFERLVRTYLSSVIGALWRAEFDWWKDKAAEKIKADPMWLAH